MFNTNPFRRDVGRRVIVHIVGGDTWRGILSMYRDRWITLTHVEYVDEHGAMGADGSVMLPESGIEWLQVTDGEEEVS